ncbi:MAG TPA: beta-ketoacyl-ACP synthase 3 [Clostridia bacterium]|nr:beta-ketoacyl-ACP synthase 3 [Clostridia bacterium]
MGIEIKSTGSCLPERIVTNDDLSTFLDTSDEWITTRTGIKTRHISVGETTSDMASRAAEVALERSGLSAQQIDLVICATVTPDVCVPMVASNVKKALGVEHAAAFDLNANCSSFIYAVTTACSLMESAGYRNAVVVGSDTNSQIVDWSDRATCVLFGDGAGAVVLSRSERKGILSSFLGGAIDRDNVLLCRNSRDRTPFDLTHEEQKPKVEMSGQGVMRFAINAFVEAVGEVTAKAQKNSRRH